MALPSGTVTFLFTDIEGSTKLLQALGADYAVLLADQRRILRAVFAAWSGREVDTQGDAFFVSFTRAKAAVEAAVEAQRRLQAHRWPGEVELRVRMGIHTGEPQVEEEGYVGISVHRAARLAHAGHGGQVLLSETTEALVRDELSEGVRLRDLGEYRLKDMPRFEPVYQLAISDLPGDFPPLLAEALIRNNLPRQLTGFIGRERELDQVKRLLQAERLVTLVGPGGVGKTRLSIQAAMEVPAGYPDGVWLVELASLADPALLAQTVARVCGVREDSARPVLASLLDYLCSRRLLLLLDNCEHLVEACARLAADILQTCPEARILASSREALGVSGEASYPVPSLAVADPEDLPDISHLMEVESIRLFVERARSIQADFSLSERNGTAVAMICKRLDGIPLAIELAAARIRVLIPEQIASRLDDRFRLLTGGIRTAMPRHQTLRATIDWSYQLLSEPEQILFRRLAVFSGGWTVEAAEAICGGNGGPDAGLDPLDILDLLSHLIDKSLIMRGDDEGTARYHWLETVRQYALEKLFDSGEGERIRDRHLDWYLRLAEEAGLRLIGRDQLALLAELDPEKDNMRAALEWSARDAEASQLGLRLATALTTYWGLRGYYSEGREKLSTLLELSGPATPPLLRANALSGGADLAYMQSDYRTTQDLYERSLPIYRALGAEGRPGLADALLGLGNVATEIGDYDSAPGLFEEGLAIMRQLGDQRGIADSLRNLGWCAMRPGDYDQAEVYLEEALAIFRQIRMETGIAGTLSGLGEVALRKGEYARAERILEESLALSRQLGIKWRTAASLGSLGWVALSLNHAARARAFLAESLEIRQEIGDLGGTAWCLEKLAELAGVEGRFKTQVKIYAAAAALRKSINSVIDPADQPEYERILARAEAELGEAADRAAWEAGSGLAVEQAIALGLEEPGNPAGDN
ncbi:MAG TPA: tetratricopeptide repeat protein [Anaerolineales bacterium]|nr:tetratricopeptide repeat protein [Anaerolineales bacterium]